MPFRPPHDEPAPPHPRLARYAGRVAEVLDDDRLIGFLLVRQEAFSTQLGGALWWRRWSACRTGAEVCLTLPGLGVEFEDGLVDADVLDDVLDDWDADRFRFAGHSYSLRWLDGQTSRSVADAEFGIGTA